MEKKQTFKKLQMSRRPTALDLNPNFEDINPYMQHGYGLWAYFQFIRALFFLFLILSLLHLPAILTFSNMRGIEGPDFGEYSKMSLGSAVYLVPVCFHAPVSNNQIYLECPSEQQQIGEVISVGLISKNNYDRDTCFFDKDDRCRDFIKVDKFSKAISEFEGKGSLIENF